MGSSLRLGRIFGVPVRAHRSVLAMVAAIATSLALLGLKGRYPDSSIWERSIWGIVAAGLFLLSILGHELGHVAAARRNGIGAVEITLWALGGAAQLEHQARTARSEFQIAIAGPLASALIGIGFLGFARFADPTMGRAVLVVLGIMNLVLAVSNLLPGAPLDGGRVLTAYLWHRSGQPEKARLISAKSGLALGLILTGLGAAELLILHRRTGWATLAAALFIATAARSELVGSIIRQRLLDYRLSDVMTRYPSPVHRSTTIHQYLSSGESSPAGIPVCHWSNEPIGYLSLSIAAQVPEADRSWTTVEDLMTPSREAPRGWADESCADALERAGGGFERFGTAGLVVVHDPRTNREVGTVTNSQLAPLLRPPDPAPTRLWRLGRAKLAR